MSRCLPLYVPPSRRLNILDPPQSRQGPNTEFEQDGQAQGTEAPPIASVIAASSRDGRAIARSPAVGRYRKTRKLHKTARLQQLRWSVLALDEFTCKCCGRLEGDTSKLVCDYVEPHRGDVWKFWAGLFQTLCKLCHDGPEAEGRDRSAGRRTRRL